MPFGIYPRLLLSWISTEAVRKQSPEIELGDSLASFGSLITAQYTGTQQHRGFTLKNVVIAEELYYDEDEQAYERRSSWVRTVRQARRQPQQLRRASKSCCGRSASCG